jgi:hypothetical protein
VIDSRTSFRINLAAGTVIVLLAILSFTREPIEPCGGLASHYSPVTAFELVRSVEDLHAIFGTTESACRTAITARLDSINRADSAIYIPVYGAFLVFFFLGMREHHRQVSMAGAWLAIGVCLVDYVENICLFHLSAAPDLPSDWLLLLIASTHVKWLGLGLAGFLGGVTLAKRGGWWFIALVFCLVGAVAALLALLDPSVAGPYLPLAIVLGWLVFLVVAARESFRRREQTIQQVLSS